MKPVFEWNQRPEAELVKKIEDDVEDFIEHSENGPCHPEDPPIVSLGITGPLDDRLEGSVRCQCGKTFIVFKGDSNAETLEWAPPREK